MKVRIVNRPTGYLSIDGGPLSVWPKVGEVIDLPDTMAEGAIASGNAKRVTEAKALPAPPVETRPAPTEQVETRGAVDAKDVRAWAAEKGIDVPKRGKIADAVVEAYTAAHEG